MEKMVQDPTVLSAFPAAEQIRFKQAAGRLIYPDKMEIERRNKAKARARHDAKRQQDRTVRAATEIRTTRMQSVYVAPPTRQLGTSAEAKTLADDIVGRLENPRGCYVCKTEFSDLHFFYDSMCLKCARFNYAKRSQTARLDGRVAVITGSRLKIGYQATLMMLRAGARVIATTRFPQDSALRYSQEPDFHEWKDRLNIYGLDLRHSPSVEIFTRYLDQTLDRLDILINNAAQTVRRPPEFYAHMMNTEALAHAELPTEARLLLTGHEECKGAFVGASGTAWLSEWHVGKTNPALGLVASAALSQTPYSCDEGLATAELFPEGKLDADLQQVDLRTVNSWRMTLAQVPTAEMLEVQLVNSVAPFILCAKLKPLMLRDRTNQKHIVNVSAMEGKFNRFTKTDKHPHTNMAKAALNMMTLTSARDYAQDGIYMNAVDTGWVTDEDPAALSQRKQENHDFQPPLDIVDGAARVCDPFFSGLLTGQHIWGNFLKDYFPTSW
ncbi:MAG: SDR family oxidoreductase [Bdellovibrionales bacterium]|nr:SDR family oxidoreductase [Bdellovibrionales bacterium]